MDGVPWGLDEYLLAGTIAQGSPDSLGLPYTAMRLAQAYIVCNVTFVSWPIGPGAIGATTYNTCISLLEPILFLSQCHCAHIVGQACVLASEHPFL